MAEKSMSLDELVRKLMGDEHADVLRETLAWFVGELMEAEVAAQIGAGLHEKSAGALDAPQRLPRAPLADPRRRDRARHPAAARRQLLPQLPRAAHAAREQALVAVVQEAYVNGVSHAQGRAPRRPSSGSPA